MPFHGKEWILLIITQYFGAENCQLDRKQFKMDKPLIALQCKEAVHWIWLRKFANEINTRWFLIQQLMILLEANIYYMCHEQSNADVTPILVICIFTVILFNLLIDQSVAWLAILFGIHFSLWSRKLHIFVICLHSGVLSAKPFSWYEPNIWPVRK